MAKLSNVTIILNPDQLSDLRAELQSIGIRGMTITHRSEERR